MTGTATDAVIRNVIAPEGMIGMVIGKGRGMGSDTSGAEMSGMIGNIPLYTITTLR